MAKLIYTAITSLDGYIADETGNFDWSAPDEEVHAFINELERGVGTYLYGRQLYEVMRFWESPGPVDDQSRVEAEYAAIWQAAEKIVFSRTLLDISTAHTTLEREFDSERIRRLKDASASDLGIGGATLAGKALKAGLVDEVNLFLSPVVVGGGTRSLPAGFRNELSLVNERRFSNGVVYLRYLVVRDEPSGPAGS
ncbi:MAG: Riboflavin biosynthesis protein ribD [Glaciihabitans sp.]|nr:Riboflavin biosynthesis protein ribD [Glaciihabitans sp.]